MEYSVGIQVDNILFMAIFGTNTAGYVNQELLSPDSSAQRHFIAV
jgi:hypothetical protein